MLLLSIVLYPPFLILLIGAALQGIFRVAEWLKAASSRGVGLPEMPSGSTHGA